MNEVIIPAVVSGASSAFAECAVNAIVGFFQKRKNGKAVEISQTAIRRYVDDYLNAQYPNLIDSRYVNEKLYEFILDFIRYAQPQIHAEGDIIINLFVADCGIESALSGYLRLPQNQKWNEIQLQTNKTVEPALLPESPDITVETLRMRAARIGLKLEIADRCSPEKIQELNSIIEKYETLYRKRGG